MLTDKQVESGLMCLRFIPHPDEYVHEFAAYIRVPSRGLQFDQSLFIHEGYLFEEWDYNDENPEDIVVTDVDFSMDLGSVPTIDGEPNVYYPALKSIALVRKFLDIGEYRDLITNESEIRKRLDDLELANKRYRNRLFILKVQMYDI